MKQTLSLLLIAALVFVAVLAFLFWKGGSDPAPDGALGRQPHAFDPLRQTSLREEAMRVVEPKVAPLPPEQMARIPSGTGVLEVEARFEDGTRPDRLEVRLDPAVSDPRATSAGFEFDSVPEGRVQVSVFGGDMVPQTHRAVPIEAGKRTLLELTVQEGLRPRGLVRRAPGGQPIAGAVIDFNGLARASSDAAGRFECDQIIPRRGLSLITVDAEGFDRLVQRGLAIADPQDIVIEVGGGDGKVLGEIVNRSSRPIPENMEVWLTIEPLWERRRFQALSGATTFRFDNLYCFRYRVELHFPGGEFPTLYRTVEMTLAEPEATTRFVLEDGATVKGRFLAPKDVVLGCGLELRNVRNEVMAETKVDAEGGYSLKGLAPGRYFPILKVGGMNRPMAEFDIAEGSGEIVRDIDVLKGRFVD